MARKPVPSAHEEIGRELEIRAQERVEEESEWAFYDGVERPSWWGKLDDNAGWSGRDCDDFDLEPAADSNERREK